MDCVLNTISEYTHFYISKNITSYTFLLVCKIVESLQRILKDVTEKPDYHERGYKSIWQFKIW